MSEGWEDWPLLGPGWKRRTAVRKSGQSCGQSDTYYQSPIGQRFRSKPELAQFLGDSVDLSCFNFKHGTLIPPEKRKKPKKRKKKGSPTSPEASSPTSPVGPQKRLSFSVQSPDEHKQNGKETKTMTVCCTGCKKWVSGVYFGRSKQTVWYCADCRASRRAFNKEQKLLKSIGCGICSACSLTENCGSCSICVIRSHNPEFGSSWKCTKRRCRKAIYKPGDCGVCQGCTATEDCEACSVCLKSIQNPELEMNMKCVKRRCHKKKSGTKLSVIKGFAAKKLKTKWRLMSERDGSSLPVKHKKKSYYKVKGKTERKKPKSIGCRKNRKCGTCEACQRHLDCGDCDFCKDKPKFGGRNLKRQKCRWRQCLRFAVKQIKRPVLCLACPVMAAIAPLRSCSGSFLAHRDLQVWMMAGTYHFTRPLMRRGPMVAITGLVQCGIPGQEKNIPVDMKSSNHPVILERLEREKLAADDEKMILRQEQELKLTPRFPIIKLERLNYRNGGFTLTEKNNISVNLKSINLPVAPEKLTVQDKKETSKPQQDVKLIPRLPIIKLERLDYKNEGYMSTEDGGGWIIGQLEAKPIKQECKESNPVIAQEVQDEPLNLHCHVKAEEFIVETDDVEAADESTPVITQIFSLGSLKNNLDPVLQELLAELNEIPLPVHWEVLSSMGPTLQLVQRSKSSTMAETVVHIQPGLYFHILVREYPVPPSHELYQTHPSRLTTVDDVVELICDLEAYRTCAGLPRQGPHSPTCHVLVEGEWCRECIPNPWPSGFAH